MFISTFAHFKKNTKFACSLYKKKQLVGGKTKFVFEARNRIALKKNIEELTARSMEFTTKPILTTLEIQGGNNKKKQHYVVV